MLSDAVQLRGFGLLIILKMNVCGPMIRIADFIENGRLHIYLLHCLPLRHSIVARIVLPVCFVGGVRPHMPPRERQNSSQKSSSLSAGCGTQMTPVNIDLSMKGIESLLIVHLASLGFLSNAVVDGLSSSEYKSLFRRLGLGGIWALWLSRPDFTALSSRVQH